MSQIVVPDIGDFKHVQVIEVLVRPGDTIAADQAIVAVESDKATLEIPSPRPGVVAAVEVAVGDAVSAGSLLLTLRSDESSGTEVMPLVPSGPAAKAATEVPATNNGRIYAGPSVRKMAHDSNVDLSEVKGSGPRGRITPADVRAHLSSAGSLRVTAPVAEERAPVGNDVKITPEVPLATKVDFARFGPIEQRPLSRIRKISAANLHRNWVTIPHVTNHDDADVTELEAFRRDLNREHESSGVRISPLAFVMKACVATLQAFPEFNSSLGAESLTLKHYYNVGFAADTPHGLVVPVVRGAERKGIVELSRLMTELAVKARAGKLSAADMQGGSFSISSLGGIGGSYFTPIINAPEVAILGIGKIQERVVWADGQPRPRLFLPLSLSLDHRVVDGAAAGRFNRHLGRVLGDIRRLLL